MIDDDDDDVVPGSYREHQLPGDAGVFRTWLTCAKQEQGVNDRAADRELLELAAKAAGLTYRDDLWGAGYVQNEHGSWNAWNPLADDGDALRLAVDLGLDVFNRPAQHTECGRIGKQGFREKHGADPYAAARRAIVQAAAELGRSVR